MSLRYPHLPHEGHACFSLTCPILSWTWLWNILCSCATLLFPSTYHVHRRSRLYQIQSTQLPHPTQARPLGHRGLWDHNFSPGFHRYLSGAGIYPSPLCPRKWFPPRKNLPLSLCPTPSPCRPGGISPGLSGISHHHSPLMSSQLLHSGWRLQLWMGPQRRLACATAGLGHIHPA